MKKNVIKFFVTFLVAGVFLSSLTSCSNETKYLKGNICGDATADGTNAFSEIRRFYCEQFVYEANLDLVAEEQKYASYSEIYKQKYFLNDNKLNVIAADSDEYISAHYIFTYYEGENIEIVNQYINSYFEKEEDVKLYSEFVDLCANGKKDGTADNVKGYFPKIKNVTFDADSYTSQVDNKVCASVKDRMTAHSKACMVFSDNFVDPTTGVSIPKTTWKQAWDVGLLCGLFVYPMSWFVNLFVTLFGATGWGQIAAIIVVTFILKILIFLITFKSQSSTQKMQEIQPLIAELQNKYGANPTPENKQRMSMEMMQIYQKYHIKPLAPFASLLITFPVFIAMYRSVMYLGILRTGKLGNVILGNNLSSYIIGENRFEVIALIIFIIMAITQVLSMKLPQFLNRKNITPAVKAQQKSMNMMSTIMLVMILVMGFSMPITMSIYWVASAIVSVVQSTITHFVNKKKTKNGRKKPKIERDPITIPQGYKK